MKLRIRGNSLRLRLSQTELAELERHGSVAETVRFPGSETLSYRVEVTPDGPVGAALSGHEIRVRLPADAVRRWRDPDEVSIRAEQPLEGGGALKILVEKDFTCLTPREGEDDSDLFPNPATRP
jgi:hypothetical protein